jgi:RNA polymerase sigma-32 factor
MSNITARLPALTNSDLGLQQYLAQVRAIPCLTQEEEFLLAKNYIEQKDKKAAHKLIITHLKLVAKIAIGYRNYGLPIAELVSEGNIGLIKAVKKYDPILGFRLSTYAMWWIRAAMQDYVMRSWSLVKIGTSATQKKLFFSLRKLKNKLSKMYSRSISSSDYKEIASEFNVKEKEVAEMDAVFNSKDISLNATRSTENSNGAELIDFIPEKRPNQEELISSKNDSISKSKALSEAVALLKTREAQIFKARKLADPILTLDVLSKKFGVSKERIRQIEVRALEKVSTYILSKCAKLLPAVK